MLQQITRFSVLQTAKVCAILYAVLGLLLVPIVWLGSLAEPDTAMSPWFIIAFPVFYGVVGFAVTAISCAIYNGIAARVGGVEFTLSGPSPE